MKSIPRIKITSRSFSRNSILKKELEQIFPDTVFNPDGPESGLTDLEDFLEDADGLILGLEKLDRPLLRRLKRLKIVAKYGVGMDNLDQQAAKECGIALGWTGGLNKRSVAEQTLGFMLGLSRNLFTTGYHLKQGIWNKQGGVQLTGKCVGIIGCGYIGTEVIHLLQPFRVQILICDLLNKQNEVDTYGVQQVSLNELLEEADIVSLHVPLTDLTHKMVDHVFLKNMKPTAYLINTCRGPVVDQRALKETLLRKSIAGAALDVFESEPPTDLEFLNLSNLMVTPHIGGNADEAVLAMGRSAIQHLKDFFY